MLFALKRAERQYSNHGLHVVGADGKWMVERAGKRYPLDEHGNITTDSGQHVVILYEGRWNAVPAAGGPPISPTGHCEPILAFIDAMTWEVVRWAEERERKKAAQGDQSPGCPS